MLIMYDNYMTSACSRIGPKAVDCLFSQLGWKKWRKTFFNSVPIFLSYLLRIISRVVLLIAYRNKNIFRRNLFLYISASRDTEKDKISCLWNYVSPRLCYVYNSEYNYKNISFLFLLTCFYNPIKISIFFNLKFSFSYLCCDDTWRS